MIQIYNPSDLNNRFVQGEAEEEWHKDNIGNESYKKILEAHPSGLYTPNYFIRIALALFTIVAVLFSGGLLGLIFSTGDAFKALLILFAILCYAALEFLLMQKKYFNAGIDNVLMTATLLLVQGFVFMQVESFLLVSNVSFLICLWLCLRFVDSFMAGLAYLFLLICIFLLYIKLGAFAKATAPFAIMLLSAIVYAIVKKIQKARSFPFYDLCLKTISLLALFTFYAAGNYWVIKELSNNMFHLNLQLHDPIPLGWLFWIFTFVIPVFYSIAGLRKKNLMLLRAGLVLVPVSCLTFRFYYQILPAEWVFLIAGIALTLLAYLLIKSLEVSRHGFTSRANTYKHGKMPGIESLIIAQAFGKKHDATSNTKFGGGNFGGAGAGEDY